MSAPMRAVGTHVEGHVLVVTIQRPEVRNAVNMAVAQGIAAAMARLDADPALHVGILTGAGHRCQRAAGRGREQADLAGLAHLERRRDV